MKCRHCGHPETSVLATRKVEGLAATKRTRVCGQCSTRFDTFEIDGGIWKTVRKWAVEQHDKALVKKQALNRRNEEIAQLIRSGAPYEQISEQFGIAKNSITAVARKLKLPKANANQRRADLRNAEILRLAATGADPQDIADKLAIARRTVMRALCKAGLGPRKFTKITAINPWSGL